MGQWVHTVSSKDVFVPSTPLLFCWRVFTPTQQVKWKWMASIASSGLDSLALPSSPRRSAVSTEQIFVSKFTRVQKEPEHWTSTVCVISPACIPSTINQNAKLWQKVTVWRQCVIVSPLFLPEHKWLTTLTRLYQPLSWEETQLATAIRSHKTPAHADQVLPLYLNVRRVVSYLTESHDQLSSSLSEVMSETKTLRGFRRKHVRQFQRIIGVFTW